MKKTLYLILALAVNSTAQEFPKEQWLNNHSDPIWAEPNAPKGGVFRGYITEFPPTFRIWGPYAHHPLRSLFSDNQLSLISFHPNTGNPIPSLASEWFLHQNNKAISFRIHEDAKWSDSTPVTAQDFVFTKSFFTSGMAKDPWYKAFYLNNIESVKAIDNKTLYIEATQPMDQATLVKTLNLRPLPKHFYSQPVDNLIKVSQWRVEPNTGPYMLSGYSFGDELVFRRKTEWWGKNLRYNQGRFNVDTVVYKIYASRDEVRAAFSQGFIDYYRASASYENTPLFSKLIERGAAHHFAFNHKNTTTFNGILTNPQSPILSDKSVRKALYLALDFERPDSKYQDMVSIMDTSLNRQAAHDAFEAKRLLTQSGWLLQPKTDIREKNNQSLSLELVYDKRISKSVISNLTDQAKDIGVELKSFPLTPMQMQTYVTHKVFDLALLALDNRNFESSTLINNRHYQTPDNWALYSKANDQPLDESTQNIAEQFWVIPSHTSSYSFGYHWRWLVFPKTPSTRAAKHLYEPFAHDGQFWIDREFLIETRTNRRKSFKFEKAIQVFE